MISQGWYLYIYFAKLYKGDEIMKIIAVQKDERGVIQQYKLDNNKVVGVEQAIRMVKDNKIENCNVFTTRSGSEAIRSNNDGDESNNLDNLPTFN